MPEKSSWIHSRFPKLSAFLDSSYAAMATGAATVGSTLALTALAMLQHWDFWGVTTPLLVAFAPLLGVPTTYVLLGEYLAKKSMYHDLTLGQDGLIADGTFIRWDQLVSLTTKKHADRQESLVLSLHSGQSLTLPSIPPRVAQKAQEAFRAFQRTPSPPPLGTTEEHYRSSRRPALVRVATNPKADPAQRIRAAEELASCGVIDQEVEDALDESLDPRVKRFRKNRDD